MEGDDAAAGPKQAVHSVSTYSVEKTRVEKERMEKQMCAMFRKFVGGKDFDTPQLRHDFLQFVATNGSMTMRELRDHNAKDPAFQPSMLSSLSSQTQIASSAYMTALSTVIAETSEQDLSRSANEYFSQSRTSCNALQNMDTCGAAYFSALQDETRQSDAQVSADSARPVFTKTVGTYERRPKHPFLSSDSSENLRDTVLASRASTRLRFMVWDKLGLYNGMFATISSHKKYTMGTKWVVFLDVLAKKIAVDKSSLVAVPNLCDTSLRICGLCAVQINNDSELLDDAQAGWCGTCKNTFYCCHQHQKQHWDQHRISCEVTQKVGYDYNVTKFNYPEIDTAAKKTSDDGPAIPMKVRAKAILSLSKALHVAVKEQLLLVSKSSADDEANYRGIIYMQVCLYYHKMAVCSLCLGHAEQAHKMMDRAQNYYDRPDRVKLPSTFQEPQFSAGWKDLERDVLIQVFSHTLLLSLFGLYCVVCVFTCALSLSLFLIPHFFDSTLFYSILFYSTLFNSTLFNSTP